MHLHWTASHWIWIWISLGTCKCSKLVRFWLFNIGFFVAAINRKSVYFIRNLRTYMYYTVGPAKWNEILNCVLKIFCRYLLPYFYCLSKKKKVPAFALRTSCSYETQGEFRFPNNTAHRVWIFLDLIRWRAKNSYINGKHTHLICSFIEKQLSLYSSDTSSHFVRELPSAHCDP